MKILSGTSNLKLSKDIAKKLKLKLVNTNIRRFADGEIYIEINENIRGNSVFVIQSTSNPANDNLMELLLVVDALKRSSAKMLPLSFHILVMQDKIEKLHQEHLFLQKLWLI